MTELTLKISVDTADLDKVEAQLKRINGLLVSTGMKKLESAADEFFITNGQVFIDEACIVKGTITSATPKPAIKYTISGLHSDKYREDLKQVVRQAIRPVIRQHIKVEREDKVFRGGVKIEPERSVTLPNAIASTQETAELMEKSQTNYEETKQQLDKRFNELQSLITRIDQAAANSIGALSARINDLECTLSANNQSTAQHLSGLQRQITQLNKQLEDARCKESINNMSIISLKQTIEQQGKSMAETIKRTIAEDLCRGGTISRAL